jgi:hypothetical protein
VIVASTSGKTAIRFAEKLSSESVRLICVSDPPSADGYPGIKPRNRKKLTSLGIEIVDRVPYASTAYSLDARENVYGAPDMRAIVFDAFRMVGGNGLKVAIEVGLMATDGGFISPGTMAITVGGTGSGADTAIVMKTSLSQDLFAKDATKRPEVREILAMPMVKKWWW